jgi:hypothetical protein
MFSYLHVPRKRGWSHGDTIVGYINAILCTKFRKTANRRLRQHRCFTDKATLIGKIRLERPAPSTSKSIAYAG